MSSNSSKSSLTSATLPAQQAALSSFRSGATASATFKMKPKKFSTRGDDFFDMLKTLGYQPPKHQQAEHFEYLFQDEKSGGFIKKLMSTLKPENCLSPQEIARHEALEKQGLVLYGRDLEEAVSRRRALNQVFRTDKKKKVEKKAELESTLGEQFKEVKGLEKLRDDIFRSEMTEWQSKQLKIACTLSIIECFIKECELDMEVDLKLLNEITEELENAVLRFRKNFKPDEGEEDSHYICQVDTSKLLEKEEKLFGKVQEMIRKHATNLIIKDAGYAVEGDPLNEDNIRKIFFQYEKDFDRLKHCIIYEKVKQISHQLSCAGVEGSRDSHDECAALASEITCVDYDTRAKLQMQTRDNINDLTVVLERESEQLSNRVKELASAAVNQQLSALTNIKARGKKKVQEFFTLTTDVLKAQKIRVLLIRNLVKCEGKLYGQLVSNIEENCAVCAAHTKKLASNSPTICGLSEEGRLLRLIVSLCGVSAPVATQTMVSVPKSRYLAKICVAEIEKCFWGMMEEKEEQSQEFMKKLHKAHETLKTLNLSSYLTDSDSIRALISEREESLRRSKQDLLAVQQNRAARSKERQQSRGSLNQRMVDVLEAL